MTLQNRVTPEGAIVAHPMRGTYMGNRGCLHDEHGKVIRTTARDAWVTCLLAFKDRHRTLMQPGHYTELFFLDEPTALAAGHRPCAECRRERYVAFRTAWHKAHGSRTPPTARDMDAQLKADRAPQSQREMRSLAGLPDGLLVRQCSSNSVYLIHSQRAMLWSFDGYSDAVDLGKLEGPFRILTPKGTAGALSCGYQPDLHPSCKALLAGRDTS